MKKLKASKSITAKGAGSQAKVMKPQLTSLIDVMTILLVFLLKSFSTDGSLITVSPEMNLAESISKESPRPALNVEITSQNILVGGKVVASLESVKAQDSMFVETVYNSLVTSDSPAHPGNGSGKIIIQCDRSVDFKILKKLMYTCGRAELKHFSLLVMEKV